MPKLRSAVWALDFGADSVTAVVAREKTALEWTPVGGGVARARGRVRGEIVKMTDAVESVTQALRQAEKS